MNPRKSPSGRVAKLIGVGVTALILALPSISSVVLPSISSAASFAVWFDGAPDSGGNAILGQLQSLGTTTIVSTANLATPGFLNAFDAVVVTRHDASFGTGLSAAAAANVAAYVGAPGPSQGGVALFTNDMADNLSGGGDPFDPNLQALFRNAATFAAASHHGYVGEFNGAAMAVTSNANGFPALGLLPGNASALHSGPVFVYDVGPIGSGNPIDAGVTFPFTDADQSPFLTDITGADPSNIVDIYTNPSINGEPAVLANHFVISGGGGQAVPEPASIALLGLGGAVVMLLGFARRVKK